MSNGAAEERGMSAEEPRTEEQAGAGADEEEPPSVADESTKGQEELREDIESTREELGETVDALSQKADVKAQVSSAVDEQKEKLRSKQEEPKHKVSGAGGGAGGDAGERAKVAMNQLAERASRQPLPYLGGAVGIGLVVGMVLRGRRSR
jgi:ElaB/YqjD/DUF883 family membrane-anchored ribosome-binding protein